MDIVEQSELYGRIFIPGIPKCSNQLMFFAQKTIFHVDSAEIT